MKKTVAICILLILFCSIFPLNIHGTENKFQIESYYVDITIKNDRTYFVTETISVYGSNVNKGLTRTIPLINEHEKLYIDNVDVNGGNFTENLTDEELIIKIDGSNTEQSMRKKYTISYTIKQYQDLYIDKDIINLDILESAWNMDINSAVVKIHLPGNDSLTSYAVKIGNDNVQKANVYKYMSNNIINIKTKTYIPALNKLKIFMTFKEGTFKKAANQNFDYMIQNAESTILFDTDCTANYTTSIQIKKNNNEANTANIYILNRDKDKGEILIDDILLQFTDESRTASYYIVREKDFFNVQIDITNLKNNDILMLELSYNANLPIHYASNYDYVNICTPFFDTIAYKSSLKIIQNSPLFFIKYTPNINFYDELNNIRNDITNEIDQNFNISINNSNILMPNEAISTQLNYVKSKLLVKIPVNEKLLLIICISIILLLILLLVIGKNKKIKINTNKDYVEIFNKYDPLKIRYYLRSKLETEDIAFLIIYWASNGNLKINKEKNNYYLVKIKELDNRSEEYERYIFDHIFQFDQKGIVNLNQLNGIFYVKAMKAIKMFEKKSLKSEQIFDCKSQFFSNIIFLFGAILSIVFLAYVFKYLDRNIVHSFMYIFLYLIFPVLLNIFLKYALKKDIGNNNYINNILLMLLSIILFAYVFLYLNGKFNLYSTYIFASIGMMAVIIAPFIRNNTKSWIMEKEMIIQLKNYLYNLNDEKLKKLINENTLFCNQMLPYIFLLDKEMIYNKTISDCLNNKPDWFEMKEEYTSQELNLLLHKLTFCFKEANLSNEILNTDFVKISSGFIHY